MKWLFLLALLLPTAAYCSDEMYLSFGFGAFSSAVNSPVEVKMYNGGYRLDIGNGFYCKFEGGAWADTSGQSGRSGSGYISSGPGIKIDLNPFEIRSGIALAAITTPDSYLGGAFPQFNEELYIGVRDKIGNGIGVEYEHISSANLYQENQGRDFAILQWSRSLP